MHLCMSLLNLDLPYRDWLLESLDSRFRLFRLYVHDFHRVFQMFHVALSMNYPYWQSIITARSSPTIIATATVVISAKRCTC